MLYGYRGLIVEWDYAAAADSSATGSSAYRLNGEDEASFPYEVDWRPDDFHRHYCPYRRLVGAGVVDRFNRESSTPAERDVEMRTSSSLAEFVRRLQGSSYARDQIQPVYRPVAVPPPQPPADCVGDNEPTGSRRDDWYSMADARDRSAIHAHQQSVASEYPTAVNLTSSSGTSSPLPVVPEDSPEDQPDVGREPAAQCAAMNGDRPLTGNGNVDHCVDEPAVVDDVGAMKPAVTVVTQTTIVRQINGGDALNAAVHEDVIDIAVNGSVHRVNHTTELLPDNGVDAATKTSTTSGYIIDEASRRTIRSDL